ncbi:MAG: hypothetical protein HYV63_02500 [Candidatus Schekmanbacteria bacterium]|nr:hypothetical protein [Candidatus Schekmanbacteria bacterium]
MGARKGGAWVVLAAVVTGVGYLGVPYLLDRGADRDRGRLPMDDQAGRRIPQDLAALAAEQPAFEPEPQAEHEADDPARRNADFYWERAYPFESIPAGARLRALKDAQRMRDEVRWARSAADTWTSLGPEGSIGLPGEFTPSWGASSGRVSALAVHPTDGRTLYVGGAQGGVWKSTDGGTTFRALTDDQPSLAVGSIAIDPNNPETIYVGTGEMAYAGDAYYGAGLLKSTNGGTTWTLLGSDYFTKRSIAKVIVHPTDSNTVFVATGVSCCTTGLTLSYGVYVSQNGGVTWTPTLTGGRIWDLKIDQQNPSVLYAAVNATSGSGVYKSATIGSSWTKLSGGGLPSFTSDHYIRLATDPNQSGVVYLSYGDSGQQVGVYKSVNGGASWTRLQNAPDTCDSQCWYDQYIAVHPRSSSFVFLGGVGWSRSTDAGATWSATFASNYDVDADADGIPDAFQAPVHVDHHAIAFDPSNPGTYYLGCDGGVWKTTDDGVSWSSLNRSGLVITQFYRAAQHPSDKGYILAGAQDNSPQMRKGSNVWYTISSGDGAATAIKQTQPEIQYISTQYLRVRRSTDAGVTWRTVFSGADRGAGFIAPFVLDPTDPSIVVAGARRMLVGRQDGVTWSNLGPDWQLAEGDSARAVSVSNTSPRAYWAGSRRGTLVVSTDSGESWYNRTAGLPARSITDVVADPNSQIRAMITMSGFGTAHVYRTNDGGQTWNSAAGGLPDIPVNSIALDVSGSTYTFYIGTDVGVFRSTNQGDSWEDYSTGLPNVAVFDLDFNDRTRQLVAATHGRGVWGIGSGGSTDDGGDGGGGCFRSMRPAAGSAPGLDAVFLLALLATCRAAAAGRQRRRAAAAGRR